MMDVEAMLSLAAEDPSVTEWKALENGLYIVTLLGSLLCMSL